MSQIKRTLSAIVVMVCWVNIAFGEVRFLSGSFQCRQNYSEKQLEATVEKTLKNGGGDDGVIPVRGAIVFGKSNDPIDFKKITDTFEKVLKKRNKDAVVVGTPGLAGVYLNELQFLPSMYEFNFLIICGNDLELKTASVKEVLKDPLAKAGELAKALAISRPKIIGVFIPANIYVQIDKTKFASAIRAAAGSDIAVLLLKTGSYAGGGSFQTRPFFKEYQEYRLKLNDEMAGFLLGGSFTVAHKTAFGFVELAGPLQVTKADKEKLLELDGRQAYQVFAEKCQLTGRGLRQALTNQRYVFCKKINNALIPLGQSYDEAGKCFVLLNPVTEKEDVYIAQADNDRRANLVREFADNALKGYPEKLGAMLFINGHANWWSYKRTLDEDQSLRAALGAGVPLAGLYADYFMSIPTDAGIKRYNNPQMGIGLMLITK